MTVVLKSLKILKKKNYVNHIKQCWHIFWNVEEKQNVKTPGLRKNKGQIMLISECTVNNSKRSRFIQEQETNPLSNLGLKTPLSKFSLLGDFLFVLIM